MRNKVLRNAVTDVRYSQRRALLLSLALLLVLGVFLPGCGGGGGGPAAIAPSTAGKLKFTVSRDGVPLFGIDMSKVTMQLYSDSDNAKVSTPVLQSDGTYLVQDPDPGRTVPNDGCTLYVDAQTQGCILYVCHQLELPAGQTIGRNVDLSSRVPVIFSTKGKVR